MATASATQVAEQRHELQRLGVRDESQHLDGMMPAGIGPASAASLAAGGGQEQVQRGLASRSAWPDGIGKTSNLARRPASHVKRLFPLHPVRVLGADLSYHSTPRPSF